ncbi:MAG: hypothetical protein H0W53_20855 [Acidobacteria bacterium]|nr:hypothetical protein [Acidobacteriota bacterium]
MQPTSHDDRTARAIVWAVWAGMLALLLWSYIPNSSRIPLAEDWYTVPLVTGQPVDVAAWLWEQNNEHRMPVARLLLLGALKASGGDYRAGGLLNMALMALAAAGLILFVRRLRGGRNDIGDAFLPLTLLHFGHSVDVLFPFQITFVLSLGLVMVVGCTLFLPHSLTSPPAAAAGGAALLLLPLSGFIGLIFVPALAAYVFYAGWSCRSGSRGWPHRRGIGAWLMSASVVTVILGAVYFVGYEHPWWNPPNPGIIPSTKVVLKVLSLGFGAAPYFWWTPAVVLSVVFLTASLVAALHRIASTGPGRDYAVGAALFFAVAIAFAAGAGWGRAGYEPTAGIPLRYVNLVIPAFLAAYFTWVLSPSPFAKVFARGLALVLLILLPINTVAGHRLFADWYHDGMTKLQADLDAGVPIEQLAERHGKFLVHWWTPEQVARHMHMLRQANIAPFNRAATLASPR